MARCKNALATTTVLFDMPFLKKNNLTVKLESIIDFFFVYVFFPLTNMTTKKNKTILIIRKCVFHPPPPPMNMTTKENKTILINVDIRIKIARFLT